MASDLIAGLYSLQNSHRPNLIFELCSYWDPAIEPENYSFVDFAVAKGYSIFYYDRLGVSKSSQ
jgi:hypothetical protein